MTRTTLSERTIISNVTEEDILNSLNKAIDTYSSKDFYTLPSDLQATSTLVSKELDVPNSKPSHKKAAQQSKEAKAKKTKKAKKASKPRSKSGLLSFKFFKKSAGKKRKAQEKESLKDVVKEVSSAKKHNKRPLSTSVGKVYTTYKQQISTFLLVFTMIGFAGLSTYIAYAYVASSTGDIVSRVSSHVILPIGETPKVYIIQSEKSEIFQNPLFKGIQVGDNVLSYTNSSKVIIYRSSEDRVVNIVNTTQ